jgi:hypothetical protein
MAIAPNARFIERLRERLTQGNADIFDSVVSVDLEIANSLNLDIDEPMSRYLI